jgi:thioredoxin reductase (NADPH)
LHKTDIAIIGAGPVGLFAVFQAGMLGMKAVVIDSLDSIGGQCTALYPEKPIYDIPAHPQILANDLIEKLQSQAAPFAPQYLLNQRVEKISQDSDTWHLETSLGNKVDAKVIIIAAGCGAFGPNRPPLDGIEQYEGSSVFYNVLSRDKFKNKKVVIAGGGDSAVDWAVSLSEVAQKVYVVHRRDKFRAMQASIDKLHALANAGKIELVIPYQLNKIIGNGSAISQIEVTDLSNNSRLLDADYLLPFFGLKMELGPIADWGLNLDKNHISVDPANMQTNVANIYAIGDIANYAGKLKLILTGFAEAASACHHAYNTIFPNKAFHFEYSTTKGVAGL